MNRRINQLLAVILSKNFASPKEDNSVLFLLPMGLGDAVMFLDTIGYYFETFKDNKIIFLTTKSADTVFRYARQDLKYELYEYDPMKMDTDVNYFLKIYKKVKSVKYNSIVYPLRGFLTMDLLFSRLNANYKITIDTNRGKIRKSFKVKTREHFVRKSKVILFESNVMDLIRYAQFASVVCKENIKSRLPYIKTNKENKGKYCQISIGSSRPEKCWPIEKFITVSEYLLTNTNLKIVFTGGKSDYDNVNIIINRLNQNKRLINRCGQTSMIELFETIAQSSFLISGDSGPVHVAVAMSVPVYCIVGGWDYERVYPYKVEIEDGRNYPVVINTGLKPCYRCLLLYGQRGATNPNCLKKINEGGPCLCIDDISPQLVINYLKQDLSE